MKNKDFCGVGMPSEEKMSLEFIQYLKSTMSYLCRS